MNNIVNTRISIRNDELSNWVSSDVTLLKGELALARRPDDDSEGAGTYELRIGVGDKKWQQLDPGNFAISASQVIGLSSTVSQLSTAHYEAASLDQLSDYSTYNNGDTAVVKSLIAGEGADAKYSYTAYVWNSELTGDNKWAAMDGNYRADNVYIHEDISCLGSYATIGNVSRGNVFAAGTSVKDLLDEVFTKELTGTTTKPSITINTTKSTVEYGSVQNPSYSFTFNHGSYEYGPSPVGTEITAWHVSTNGNVLTMVSDDNPITADTVTNSMVACNPNQITATFTGTGLTSNIYTISAEVDHTAASCEPNTNKGNPDSTPGNQITANQCSGYSMPLYTVYKPRYIKVTSSFEQPPTTINAADLTSSTTPVVHGSAIRISAFDKWFKMDDAIWPTVISVNNNYYNVFFAAPKGIKSNWTAKKSDNVNVLPTSETPSDATVTYLNDTTATYSVYQINNATPYDDNKCNITWVS